MKYTLRKIVVTAALIGSSLAPFCANIAQATDLLSIKVMDTGNGKTVAQVKNQPDAGINPFDLSQLPNLVPSDGVVDLFGTLFDPGPGGTTEIIVAELWPGGPLGTRFLFEPITLRPNQQFFGVIGFATVNPCDAVNYPDGISEEDFRDLLMANYEVEVNGVAFRGDNFPVLDQVPIQLGPDPVEDAGFLTTYDYTMVLTKPGRYSVIFRGYVGDTLNCGIGPEFFSHEFTIDIE